MPGIEFIISDESLNRNGYRVLNSALNFDSFNKNPVMLFNHVRSGDGYKGPIGRWENVRLTEKGWIAEAVFDENDKFAMSIKKKVEGGFLKASSIHIADEDLEVSTDTELMLPGQWLPTVTKAGVLEISICDIPANTSAFLLFNKEGKPVDFTNKKNALNYLLSFSKNPNKNPKMELKLKAKTIQTLSLGESPTAEQIDEAVDKLQTQLSQANKKYNDLVAEQKAITDKRKKKLLDTALAAGKFKAEERSTFETLDYDVLKLTLEKIPGVTLPANAINNGSGKKSEIANDRADWTLNKWMKSDYKGLMELKANDADAYAEIVKRK
ncbi:MAG TPA: HK97 family phage prohead protease [Bacteroidia bacterium]|nr:HK97 family phage prohead protease [Bacteroidia bacterium]